MRESQARLSLKGPLERPTRVVSCRAGAAFYKPLGARGLQRTRSLATDPDLIEAIAALELAARDKLERFSEMNAELRLQGLIRRRSVLREQACHRRFHGFWGTLRFKGSWPAIFGAGPENDLIFRRGPWEEWPRTGTRLSKIEAGIPLILSPYCGTLLHETVGHAMEAEYLPESPLRHLVGKPISHPDLSIMDHPRIAGAPGSMSHDDTGRIATETTLIHRGVLVGDLNHQHGVFRRSSYREIPLIRATNFIVRPGKANPDDWLQNLPVCYYASWIKSGNWQPGGQGIKVLTGPFFRLERGQPVAWADWTVLNFHLMTLLEGIREIGADFRMDPAVHWCMKKNQAVPMGMGSPSLLLEGVLS